MEIQTHSELLKALLSASSSAKIQEILAAIGDRPDLSLDEQFGPLNLQWHAFGNNPSNLSSVGLGAKPGRSLTERVTNATDAVLEDRFTPGIEAPRSARLAAKQWFGRPISGPDDRVYEWILKDPDLSRRIIAVLLPSGSENSPTIDIFDDGIGIPADLFPSTILSLQAGNKIKKWYLIGAFGQGGAATLGFSEYAVIVSRPKESPEEVGFTVVRVLNLNETYKEDCYGYLSYQEFGKMTVPHTRIESVSLDIYPPVSGIKLPGLLKGTMVRHVNYRLANASKGLSASPGNLYHYLHFSMFDPLLPFRLIDLRSHPRDEVVTGSRNRLMKLASVASSEQVGEDSGSVVRHQRQMEYVSPLGTEETSIGIEYWVVFNYRKGRGADKKEIGLRPQSNELYIQTGHPVVGTLNGQTQGEMTAQLLRDIGLGMVARHLIVHIDATNANSRVRRELFSTNREGFKEGPILDDLTRILKKMLEEDENLYEIERELTEKLAKREMEATSQEVKRQVTRLLMDAGLQLREEGPTYGHGSQEKQTVRARKGRRYRKLEPLPTLAFPHVTKFKIVSPLPSLDCRLNDTELVLVETDADSEFDRQGRLALRSEPAVLEIAAKVNLKGGRVRWRVRPRLDCKAGTMGVLIVTITKPDGAQLRDEVPFAVLARKEKGYIPPFEIIAVNPYDDSEIWETVWPDLGEEGVDEGLEGVAYKPMKVGGGINVYYSTIFRPFKVQEETLKAQNPALSELFRTNYEIWIGYHAILQENGRPELNSIDSDVLEKLLENDRIRVARMQVRQATGTAELMHKMMKGKAAE
jgi:hypothetical protein